VTSVRLHRRRVVTLAVVFIVATVGVLFVQGAWALWARASPDIGPWSNVERPATRLE
jgi:hypothetical protein